MSLLSNKYFTIMVLDDMPLMLQMVKDSLTKLPHIACVLKKSLTSAVTFAKQHPIDMAIIDLNLGERNGVELIHLIRSGNLNCAYDIPICVLSGNTYKSSIEQCKTLDVQEVLAKPIQPLELQQRISRYREKVLALKSPEFYQRCLTTDRKSNIAKASASITMPEEKSVIYYSDSHKKTKQLELPPYTPLLVWPNATTGKHQLDMRLKQLCHLINMMLYTSTESHLKNMVPKLIDEAQTLMDDIQYIAQKYQSRSAGEPQWPALIERIAELRKLPFALLNTAKITGKDSSTIFTQKAVAAWNRLSGKPVFVKLTPPTC